MLQSLFLLEILALNTACALAELSISWGEYGNFTDFILGIFQAVPLAQN